MKLIRTSEACKILGCTPIVFTRRVDQGVLSAYTKEGEPHRGHRGMYFDEEAILALKLEPAVDDGREWLPVDAAAAFLGVDRLTVYRLGREERLLRRPVPGPTCNGRRTFEFECGTLEAYRERVYNAPRTAEEQSEWMPIKSAMKQLNLTRRGIKKRAEEGRLDTRHFGPPEKPALFFRRSQIEEQAAEGLAYRQHKPVPVIDATEIEVIWAAGFFDGEGCITIARKGKSHYLNLGLVNSSFKSVHRLQAALGGAVRDRPRQKPHYRDQMSWAAVGNRAYAILQRMRPYMSAKDAQADLGIEFQEHMQAHQYSRWDMTTEQEFEWREAQKEKISRLNRPNVPRD